MRFNHAIHTLRGLASLSVVLFHIRFVFGENSFLFSFLGYFAAGVEVFFIISGYVLLQSLFHVNYSIIKYPIFVLKRFIRIEPLYILVLSFAALQSIYHSKIFGDGTYIMEWQRYFSHFAYLTKFMHQEWWLAAFWTLGLEFQFYLLIGLLCLLLFSKNKWLNFTTILLLSILKLIFINEDVVFYYLWFFVLGIILFQIKNQLLPKYFGILSLIFLIIAIGIKHESLFVACVCACSVIIIYYEKFKINPLNFLGDISYPLYLCHGLILAEAAKYISYFNIQGSMKLIIIPILYVIGSILLAWLLHKFIEIKCLKISKKIKY